MTTCPHCQQPIPDPPKSGGAGPILLWGGLGVLLGLLGSCCLIGIVAMASITSAGNQANKTFQTVGNSLSAS